MVVNQTNITQLAYSSLYGIDNLFLGIGLFPILMWFGAAFMIFFNLNKNARLQTAISQAQLLIIWGSITAIWPDLFLTPFPSFIKILIIFFFYSLINSLKNNTDPYLNKYEPVPLLLIILGAAIAILDSYNLFSIYLILELQSLILFILIALRQGSLLSIEAAIKYLVLSGLAAASYLFGVSFVYGTFGVVDLISIGQMTVNSNLLMPIPVVLILVGLFIKLAVAPFHFWAPDVYEGAPSFVVNQLATVSKMVAYFVTIRIVIFLSASVAAPILIFSFFSILVGAFGAFYQTDLRRFIAYSGINHIGLILIAAIDGPYVFGSELGTVYFFFYFFTVAAFLFILITLNIERGFEGTNVTRLQDLIGLYDRSPTIATLMTISILSLAGIPPLGGFYGKMMVLLALVDNSRWILIVPILLVLLLSSYYYLRLIKSMHFEKTVYSIGDSDKFKRGAIIFIVIATFINLFGFFYLDDLSAIARLALINRFLFLMKKFIPKIFTGMTQHTLMVRDNLRHDRYTWQKLGTISKFVMGRHKHYDKFYFNYNKLRYYWVHHNIKNILSPSYKGLTGLSAHPYPVFNVIKYQISNGPLLRKQEAYKKYSNPIENSWNKRLSSMSFIFGTSNYYKNYIIDTRFQEFAVFKKFISQSRYIFTSKKDSDLFSKEIAEEIIEGPKLDNPVDIKFKSKTVTLPDSDFSYQDKSKFSFSNDTGELTARQKAIRNKQEYLRNKYSEDKKRRNNESDRRYNYNKSEEQHRRKSYKKGGSVRSHSKKTFSRRKLREEEDFNNQYYNYSRIQSKRSFVESKSKPISPSVKKVTTNATHNVSTKPFVKKDSRNVSSFNRTGTNIDINKKKPYYNKVDNRNAQQYKSKVNIDKNFDLKQVKYDFKNNFKGNNQKPWAHNNKKHGNVPNNSKSQRHVWDSNKANGKDNRPDRNKQNNNRKANGSYNKAKL